MFTLSLRQEYFDAIKSGSKTAEGRPNSSKFKDLKPGMDICFRSTITNETIICSIQGMHVYTNFADMLHQEGIDTMLPGVASIEQGVALYESFPGYSDRVKECGALAIKIKNSPQLN